MRELEKNVMCVLLRSLLDKNLITQDIHDKAMPKLLDTLDGSAFFCYCEEKCKEESDGHTQNSC